EDLITAENLLENQEPRPDFRATKILDLPQFRVKEGDVITYWLTVRDNKDPVPNRMDTARQVIEVTAPVTPEAKKKFESKQTKEAKQLNPPPPPGPQDVAPNEKAPDTPPPGDLPKPEPAPQAPPAGPGQNTPPEKSGANEGTARDEAANQQQGPP